LLDELSTAGVTEGFGRSPSHPPQCLLRLLGEVRPWSPGGPGFKRAARVRGRRPAYRQPAHQQAVRYSRQPTASSVLG